MKYRQRKKFYMAFTAFMIWFLLSCNLQAKEWEAIGETINKITINSLSGKIVEENEVPPPVFPGSTVDKKVNVKNTGGADLIVRVSIEKYFGDRFDDGTLVKDQSLNPGFIQLKFNTHYWKKIGSYWYYTEILESGAVTKEPLISAYTLSTSMGNEYQGKDAEINVSMECIQASEDALNIWGVSNRNLGIHFQEKKVSETTYISFSESRIFQFSENRDLFANFKDVVPGKQYEQIIEVKNQSDEIVEFFLRSELTEQNGRTDHENAAISEFLRNGTDLELYIDGKLLYKGSTDGYSAAEGNNLKDTVSLGTFRPDEVKQIKVVLNVHPDNDNRIMNLTGTVKWVVEGRGNEEYPKDKETQDPAHPQYRNTPKTGDDTDIASMVITMISSFAFLIGFIILYRKQMKGD